MKALILSGSPRRNGNSAALAQAAAKGLSEAGHQAKFIFADDAVARFLRDCRQCRRADGECGIDDGFRAIFLRRLSACGRFYRGDACLLVRHVGPTQGFLRPYVLLRRGVASAVVFSRRADDGKADRASVEFRRDISDSCGRHRPPDPGI